MKTKISRLKPGTKIECELGEGILISVNFCRARVRTILPVKIIRTGEREFIAHPTKDWNISPNTLVEVK